VRVYLDWNATAPALPAALDAMAAAHRDAWGNPSSVHETGRRARACVEDARESVARLAGASPHDVTFTSGGTEANNIAVRSLVNGFVVASRIEHPSVVRVVEQLQIEGADVVWVEPEASGAVSVASIQKALAGCKRPADACVCLQAVNHETGVMQPVADAIEAVHAAGARIHVDAVQAVGKLDPGFWRGADTVSIAAHKIGGPKGIGAVVCGPCVVLRPLLAGGGQEYGIRPGTLSAPLAAGFRIAAEWAIGAEPIYVAIRPLRDRLEQTLIALGGRVNGGPTRVPHVCNVSFEAAGDELAAALDLEGVCVSSGSACSSGASEMSPVVAAMAGDLRARGAVRASLGPTTTAAEITYAEEAWGRVLHRVRDG
jgi:cysteine desulfurase